MQEGPTSPQAAVARPWDVPVGERIRPSLSGRLYFLVGGALSVRHHEWVRRDLVASGWRRRQVIRLSVPFAVSALAFGLLPGSASLRASIAGMFLLAGPLMGLATSTHFRNRRLEMHGFAPVPPPVNPEDLYVDPDDDQPTHFTATD